MYKNILELVKLVMKTEKSVHFDFPKRSERRISVQAITRRFSNFRSNWTISAFDTTKQVIGLTYNRILDDKINILFFFIFIIGSRQ